MRRTGGALYVLCVPADAAELADVAASAGPQSRVSVEESETPTFFAFDLKKNPYAGAREIRSTSVPAESVTSQERSNRQEQPRWPRSAVAGSRADRLALVETLQAAAPALRASSARALRSELRPWLDRAELGWDMRWLLHALDHTPDGQAHPCTAAVRVPLHWLRYRMSRWLDEQGRPLPSPGVQQAAARSAQQTETAPARDEQHAQAKQLKDERTFGEPVRQIAGPRYPTLVQAILTRHADTHAARLMPTVAAEAVTRAAVREVAGPAMTRETAAADVDALLAKPGHPGT